VYGRYSQPYSLGGSSDVASGYQYCSNLLLLLRQWRHEGVCRPGGKRLCCRHRKSDRQLIFLFHVMQIPAESVSALGVLNNYALYKSTHSLTHSLTHLLCNANANSPEVADFQKSISLPLQMSPPAHCLLEEKPPFPPPLYYV